MQTTIDFERPIAPRDPNIDARDVKRVSRQSGEILYRLMRGPATNSELCAMALNYRARVSDLRAAGYVIRCQRREGGLTVYTLEGQP